MLSDLIPEADLVKLWRIHPNVPYYWRRRGLITSAALIARTHWYTPQGIDEFHANDARNFETVPSVIELLATEQPSLLTPHEVRAKLDCTDSSLWHRVQNGHLPCLALTSQLHRYPAKELAIYLASLPHDEATSAATASRILCVSRQYIRKYAKEKLLETVHNKERPSWLFVSRLSILTLLAAQVRGTTPEEWWRMAISEPGRLRTKEDAMDELRIAHKTITPLLATGQWPCLVTNAGFTYLPTSTIDRLRKTVDESRSKTEMALPDRARTGKLCGHNMCLSTTCLARYIDSHRTGGFTADEWLTLTQGRNQLILLSELSESEIGMDTATAQISIKNGTLRGVRLPGGDIAILRVDVVALNRRMERTDY